MSDMSSTEDTRASNTTWVIERADEVRRTGSTLIPNVFTVEKIDELNRVFQPLLDETIRAEGNAGNRGPGRYYITPTFRPPWTDPSIIDNDIIMAIVTELVGADGVFCQLATDTPCKGSEYQELHSDTQPLFPEWGFSTCRLYDRKRSIGNDIINAYARQSRSYESHRIR
jgi:hypothetical protein